MSKTSNGPVHPFFSQKIRTLLSKFRANGSVCGVFGPLQALNVSCTPCCAFHLCSSLIALAVTLAHCCSESEGNELITMRG